MKYILLFLALACGKHTEPSMQDPFINPLDPENSYPARRKQISEGSQAQNNDILTYSINQQFNGSIEFLAGETVLQKYQFPISYGIQDNYQRILEHLTFHQSIVEKSTFLLDAEIPRIYLHGSFDLKLLKPNYYYDIWLHFDKAPVHPSDIFLIDPYKETRMAELGKDANFKLSTSELADLMRGLSRLVVRSTKSASDPKPSHQLYYRVFYSDQKQSQIFYVHNDYHIKDFLLAKGLTSPQTINFDLELIQSSGHTPLLWQRKIKNDYFISYTTLDHLKEAYLRSFQNKKNLITRIDGSPLKSLKISKPRGAKAFVIIKNPKQITYNYNTVTKEIINHYEFSFKSPTCNVMILNKTVKKNVLQKIDSILNQISINIDGKAIANHPNQSIEVLKVKHGKVDALKLIFKKDIKDIEISLKPYTKKVVVIPPHKIRQCAHLQKPISKNIEHSYTTEWESLIENI